MPRSSRRRSRDASPQRAGAGARGHAADTGGLLARSARRTVRWTALAVVQRLVSVVVLTAVLARLADPVLSDRFFMGLGLVEGIGTLVPVGFMAIVTPSLVTLAPAEAARAALRAGRRVLTVTLVGIVAVALAAAWFGSGADVSDSAFRLPPAAVAAFALAAALLAATAPDAAVAQRCEHAEYLAVAPLAGNATTLALLLLGGAGEAPLTRAALAVTAGTGVHWALLRVLSARAVSRATDGAASPDRPVTPAAASALSLTGGVLLAGLVQGAASLLVLLARVLVGGDPGAVTDVSLALRIALLPPGLLAYPAWLTTAPLLARPDLDTVARRALLGDGLDLVVLAIGVVGGGMAGASVPLVALFFGQGGLTAAQVGAAGDALAWALPLAVSAGAFVFLGGPFQARGRNARLAAWIAVGLAIAAVAGGVAARSAASLGVPTALATVAALGAVQCALYPLAARDVPGGVAPPTGRTWRTLAVALLAIAAGGWVGARALATAGIDATAGGWTPVVAGLATGGGAGAVVATLVVLLGSGRRHLRTRAVATAG